jgi:hypothetical protein
MGEKLGKNAKSTCIQRQKSEATLRQGGKDKEQGCKTSSPCILQGEQDLRRHLKCMTSGAGDHMEWSATSAGCEMYSVPNCALVCMGGFALVGTRLHFLVHVENPGLPGLAHLPQICSWPRLFTTCIELRSVVCFRILCHRPPNGTVVREGKLKYVQKKHLYKSKARIRTRLLDKPFPADMGRAL